MGRYNYITSPPLNTIAAFERLVAVCHS